MLDNIKITDHPTELESIIKSVVDSYPDHCEMLLAQDNYGSDLVDITIKGINKFLGNIEYLHARIFIGALAKSFESNGFEHYW